MRQGRQIAAVGERYEDIADEAVAPYAFDRRAGKEGAETGIVERDQICEARRDEIVAGAERHFAGRHRKFVPRADSETIVAAIDAVADGTAELARDMALVLDGEIGNAAPRIKLIGRGEGIGGADVEAAMTLAAMIFFGRIRLNRQRRENRTEKKPRAEFTRDEIGVLALPAEAGASGRPVLNAI